MRPGADYFGFWSSVSSLIFLLLRMVISLNIFAIGQTLDRK
jgi:hypothetical protein